MRHSNHVLIHRKQVLVPGRMPLVQAKNIAIVEEIFRENVILLVHRLEMLPFD